jgi:NAD-dependent SIR2 family protein deacetylase
MAEYTDISREEMVDFLAPQGFVELSLPNTKEMVMGKLVAKDVCMRVYTSIVDDTNRDNGKDAIRVGIFFKRSDGRIVKVAGSKRVHRVKGWRSNLANRLARWQDQMYPSCHKCSMPTLVRKNRKDGTEFLGCSQYPNCRATRPMPQ